MSKMFPFITDTWNPLGGQCPHNCKGCWAKDYINRLHMKKYLNGYFIDPKQIDLKFASGSFIFVSDMLDLFAKDVPMEAIQIILNRIKRQPEVTFLLLTKNPRYMWMWDLPKNVVAGATIETDFVSSFHYTNAPSVVNRIEAMQELDHPRKFVSIEPIMQFTFDFPNKIISIKPEFVAVGYDNYGNGFPEPTLWETEEMVGVLEKAGIKVYRKTLREPLIVAGDETQK